MAFSVRSFMSLGKYRNIEVEDDGTAYVEYENGATGLFVTSIGEAPGTNRLEISGDKGKIVVEDGKLTFWRLRTPESQFNEELDRKSVVEGKGGGVGGHGVSGAKENEVECWLEETEV